MLVIPNELRDLTVGDGSDKLLCAINQLMRGPSPSARLGMIALLLFHPGDVLVVFVIVVAM
jgi:hypothetical protein